MQVGGTVGRNMLRSRDQMSARCVVIRRIGFCTFFPGNWNKHEAARGYLYFDLIVLCTRVVTLAPIPWAWPVWWWLGLLVAVPGCLTGVIVPLTGRCGAPSSVHRLVASGQRGESVDAPSGQATEMETFNLYEVSGPPPVFGTLISASDQISNWVKRTSCRFCL